MNIHDGPGQGPCQGQSSHCLVNVSPNRLDVATSNSTGAYVNHSITWYGCYWTIFCVTMTTRSRSKVKKLVFAMVCHRVQSSCILFLYSGDLWKEGLDFLEN